MTLPSTVSTSVPIEFQLKEPGIVATKQIDATTIVLFFPTHSVLLCVPLWRLTGTAQIIQPDPEPHQDRYDHSQFWH